MSKISVSVTDGTNVNLTVSPRPTQTITVSRGSATQGTVTQVTANTPLSVTNGTTTPDLSIAQANGSTAGYLTAGDWSAFNSKVSTVSGTAPVTITGTTNAIVSMAAATDSVSGYLTSTDHATFNAKVGSITSADGSITVTGTTTRDLSVASSPNVIVQVRNNTGATLTKGTAVYINGAIGQLPTITKAQANSDATSAQTLGLMTADLANNSNGSVTIIGLITDFNTSAYTDGQQLYLSPTTAGALTATKPSAPQHLVYVAVVEHAHITQGKLFVKVQNGYELDELHDVQIISPTNGQTLTYDSATSLWKNTTPTSGGVTSVTATSPVASTGGTTPVISMPAATDSVSGYLTSTDHAAFNAKQAALISGTNIKTVNSTSLLGSGDVSVGTVTSVGGTGTVSGISLSGTVTNTGSLTLGGSLDLSSPPAIGGTTPNTITGTTVTAADLVGGSPPSIVVNDATNSGVTATINIDQATYSVVISATDGTVNYPLQCDAGLYIRNGYPLTIANAIGSNIVISAPVSLSPYGLILPTTPGSNNQVLKTDGAGNLNWVNQGVQPTAPVTVTTATHSVATTTQWLIANRAGTITLTLPTASSNTGRSLNIKTTTANTVVSASSNVVPLAGGAANTAILAATAGKFATLVSDGFNWIIMAAN